MSVKRLANSFKDAMNGIRHAFENEQNFRLQMITGLVALFFAVWLPIRDSERLLIVIMVFMVLIMELLNTAMELFIDLLKPRLHHYVKAIKDIMAGAVFLTSFAAMIVGIIIFGPYLIAFLKGLLT